MDILLLILIVGGGSGLVYAPFVFLMFQLCKNKNQERKMYNGLVKHDPRIKHRFVTVFPVNFIRGKHKCRDGVERSVIWEKPWKLGGVIFIPLFKTYLATRFCDYAEEKSAFTYFSFRFIWWQINATFWYSK